MSPYGHTLRELAWMAIGSWNHTAAIQAIIANVNRDPKKSAYTIEAFHPYMSQRGRGGMPLDKRSLHMMKNRFKKKDNTNGSR